MGTSKILKSITYAASCVLGIAVSAITAACPLLDPYYPADENQWPLISQQLLILMPECLDSAEYFALLGASQMNSGLLASALEALERSLLLDPDNGAAQIDYAQALYQAGQIFPALEMNRNLLNRADLPPQLVSLLQARQTQWLERTTRKGLFAEAALGYDDNLNGAPSRSDLTLTLSGEPVQVTLDEKFQPVSGPYLNLRLAGVYQRQTPDFSHDFLGSIRSRSSEDSQSDLLQLDWRYSLGGILQDWKWDLTAGTSHLIYGGSPLYSVTETRVHIQPDETGCQPQYGLAAQYQLYHGQSNFTGVESSATAGFECRPDNATRLIGFEVGAINNYAIKDFRPGGNRNGWKLRLYWELPVGPGQLSTQLSLASLGDSSGYNELLANGARRKINSRMFRLQYRQDLQEKLVFMFNLSHQGQSSNLEPFQNSGTALELGLSYNL